MLHISAKHGPDNPEYDKAKARPLSTAIRRNYTVALRRSRWSSATMENSLQRCPMSPDSFAPLR
jgi:hypothetical protein